MNKIELHTLSQTPSSATPELISAIREKLMWDVLHIDNLKSSKYDRWAQVRLKKSALKKVWSWRDSRVYKLKTDSWNFALKQYHNERCQSRRYRMNRNVLDDYYKAQALYREYLKKITDEVEIIWDPILSFNLSLDFCHEISESIWAHDESYRVVMPRVKGKWLKTWNKLYNAMKDDEIASKLYYDEVCTVANVKERNDWKIIITDLWKNIIEFTRWIFLKQLEKRLA